MHDWQRAVCAGRTAGQLYGKLESIIDSNVCSECGVERKGVWRLRGWRSEFLFRRLSVNAKQGRKHWLSRLVKARASTVAYPPCMGFDDLCCFCVRAEKFALYSNASLLVTHPFHPLWPFLPSPSRPPPVSTTALPSSTVDGTISPYSPRQIKPPSSGWRGATGAAQCSSKQREKECWPNRG